MPATDYGRRFAACKVRQVQALLGRFHELPGIGKGTIGPFGVPAAHEGQPLACRIECDARDFDAVIVLIRCQLGSRRTRSRDPDVAHAGRVFHPCENRRVPCSGQPACERNGEVFSQTLLRFRNRTRRRFRLLRKCAGRGDRRRDKQQTKGKEQSHATEPNVLHSAGASRGSATHTARLWLTVGRAWRDAREPVHRDASKLEMTASPVLLRRS